MLLFSSSSSKIWRLSPELSSIRIFMECLWSLGFGVRSGASIMIFSMGNPVPTIRPVATAQAVSAPIQPVRKYAQLPANRPVLILVEVSDCQKEDQKGLASVIGVVVC